ncbi:hypothetical protein KKI43_25375, partial [Arthrobacter sp. GN70]|nr:hypothetical protein [Arthrobacter sp. GN70]
MTIEETEAGRAVAGAGARPFEQLSRDELARVVGVLKSGPAAGESFRFSSVSLHEPAKAALRAGSFSREAEVVLVDRDTNLAYEAIVDVPSSTITRWVELPAGTQPPIMADEFAECE